MRREGQRGGKKAKVEDIKTEREREKDGEDGRRTEMRREGRR